MLKVFSLVNTRVIRVQKAWQSVCRTSPFAGHMVLTAGTNILLALLGLVTGVLAARLLGPEGRGELAAIQLWPTFIATVAMLGLPDALVYFSAREPDKAGRYLGSAMSLAVLSSLPFMVVGYLVIPLLLSAQSAEVIRAARWYLLLVPLYTLVGMPYHPLRGRHDFGFWNALRITPNIGWLVVLVLAWFLGQAEPQFVAVAYLVVLSLLFFPVTYIVVKRIPGPFWPDTRKWKPMAHYGVPSVISSVPQMLNFRLDQILMAALLPAQVLGLYVVAVAWSGAVQPLLTAIGTVLFPNVASQPDRDQQALAFAQGTRFGVFGAIVMTIIFMVLTPWLLPFLFGARFAAAITAALVLVVASAIASVSSIMEDGLRGLGHPTAVMWAEFAGLVVTAISLWFLLRPLGIMGAALSSLLGYSAVAILLITQGRWLTGCSATALLMPTLTELAENWKRLKVFMETFARYDVRD